MLENDLFVTNKLARRHESWNKIYPYSIDYLTKFYNDFKKYKRQSDSKSFIKGLLDNVITLIKVNSCKQSYCDVTDYLEYITTRTERDTCFQGLWMFLDFGGIVQIGDEKYTQHDSNDMVKEILNRTKHVK